MPDRDDLGLSQGRHSTQTEWVDPPAGPPYVELHCISNFSFLRGASHPEELVARAYDLGYKGIALTDECSVSGLVRAWLALKQHHSALDEAWLRAHPLRPIPPHRPFQVIFGAEFALPGLRLVALPHGVEGWGGLCEFITAARTGCGVAKGTYAVSWEASDFKLLSGCEILLSLDRPCDGAIDSIAARAILEPACERFGTGLWLLAELHGAHDDALWLRLLQSLGLPLVAASDVHLHTRARKPLQDVLTAIRCGTPVQQCGQALQANAQRYLQPRDLLARRYPPALIANTQVIASRCRFDLKQIAYNYPMESVPAGLTPSKALRALVRKGCLSRYPGGVPRKVKVQIDKELRIIATKGYEMYFLTVEDIVRYARSQRILCQGRGSAANSAVCYVLGITEVRPEKSYLLFERFISEARDEAPDIDVDFEHQRREEVIQYIYGKYGRDRAAIAAVVVRYRSRSAIRDVGKALGIDDRLVDVFAKDHFWFDQKILEDQLGEACERAGVVQPPFHLLHWWMELTHQIRDFPRHLSQHVGGFVLTQSKLTRLVPVENASMKDRSVIQWEKDDLEAAGLMKVDVLALGMLSALRRALEFRNAWRGAPMRLQDIPDEHPAVYDMICTADTVGVFQVESRAQMSMLPRLKPRKFYDLVVEVAIVRPGPIQGKMVHPYLKARENQRQGKAIHYIQDGLKNALERTLGVPIFQEQVMQLAVDAAGFTLTEADALRRSMAAWKREAGIYRFKDKLVEGMLARKYPRDFAEGIFEQIRGFGEYGFPESHAASFAQLVYFSCWMKCFEPAAFLAAMLDAQPMGFYSPSQLVQDARRHGVEVRPVDVTSSGVDCVLEVPAHAAASNQAELQAANAARPEPPRGHPTIALRGETCWPGTSVPQPIRLPQPAVRLSLRQVSGLSALAMQRIVAARTEAPFTSVEDLALRADIDSRDMQALAAADALHVLAGHRRQQVWEATAQRRAPGILRGVPVGEAAIVLPHAPEGEEIVADYAATGLTLRRHPLALLRPRLAQHRMQTSAELRPLLHGMVVRACGIVTMRQRPPTAKGTLFVTLEDETGAVNVIVLKDMVEAHRDALMRSRLLAVEGVWQRDMDSGGEVRHLLGRHFKDLTPWLGRLGQQRNRSRDFH